MLALPRFDRDAFLEVQMDRVVPAAAAVLVGPMLDLAGLGNNHRDAVGVERVGVLAVDANGPGSLGNASVLQSGVHWPVPPPRESAAASS